MRERLSLEQLKAMSGFDLKIAWNDDIFPFDRATCGLCITQHHTQYSACTAHAHADFIAQVTSLGEYKPGLIFRIAHRFGRERGQAGNPRWLRQHLEELYALRLFYDHLYPQPEQPIAAEQAFAKMEEEFLDSRAGTRD